MRPAHTDDRWTVEADQITGDFFYRLVCHSHCIAEDRTKSRLDSIADAHNAALAAEQEKTLRWCKHWSDVAQAHDCENLTDAFVQLTQAREQLLQAQAAIAKVLTELEPVATGKARFEWPEAQRIVNTLKAIDDSLLREHDAEVKTELDRVKRDLVDAKQALNDEIYRKSMIHKSALEAHDAEIRKPLVDLLRKCVPHPKSDLTSEQLADALAKVKEVHDG